MEYYEAKKNKSKILFYGLLWKELQGRLLSERGEDMNSAQYMEFHYSEVRIWLYGHQLSVEVFINQNR